MNKHREVYLERLGDMRHVFGPPLVMEAGFAFDVETISDARDLGAEWVIVVTRNGRKRWIARLDAFAEHGQPFRVEGYNAQLCLALRHWKVRELTRHLVGAS
ncbi:MAG TPA: hypothetical protein VKZ50_04490 [bacterium]|nr:hypothetical protein [bacterium]